MTGQLRAPRNEDLQTVLDVVIADDMHEIGRPDVEESDVAEWWAMPHLDKDKDAWLLERDGTAAGYAQTHDRNQVGKFETDVWVVDEKDEEGYGQLLSAAMTRAKEVADQGLLDKCDLVTWSVVGRELREAWLADRGFAKVRRFYRMEVHLEQAEPPALDSGVTITPVGQDEDARRTFQDVLSKSFVGHWGYQPIDYDTWLGRVTASPQLDWDLLWLARVDGQPAAVLKMRLNDDIAFIDNVGTLSEFRGRGLALTLLRVAFAESLRRGQPNVELGVDTQNETKAVALYEKAGMSVAFAQDEWSRDLRQS
jgi:ribosomal protein S18 acetylase RimI-like enzyme